MRLVHDTLDNYADIIARNEMLFFRPYTDHGTQHVEDVLETTAALVTEESFALISPEDVSVLISATVLHDLALHLQETGFITLVSSAATDIRIPELDTIPWNILWRQYVSEMSRLNQLQIYGIYGVTESIPEPRLDRPNSWTQIQLAYIGEFIRRYHHRLAHEIARYGLPGVATSTMKTDYGHPLTNLVDLAGVVARSHGTTIRSLFTYLTNNFHLRQTANAHPVYLMILLRIADFLQLQAGRAPGSVLKVKTITSPLSRREWNVHHAISDIIYDEHEDPETVEIQVNPAHTTIDIFLRIKEWIHGIQIELDTSWAVLGEVFGRYKERQLGITIRRVRSNIDDADGFGRKAGYIPRHVSFTAADVDLLKLFIRPLYGNRPEIAVRELVQNGVDAIRERWAVEPQSAMDANLEVLVQIRRNEDDSWSLIVDDKGVGMTLDTLANFYLNVGASYRTSMAWKQMFQDNEGISTVLRSGRFGIGALSAFLLDDDPLRVTLKVSTRHVFAPSEDGLELCSVLTDAPLTIRRVERASPGTRIEVRTRNRPLFMEALTSNTAYDDVWDWYCFSSPRVRRIDASGREVRQSTLLPDRDDNSAIDYHWIYPDGYQAVGWTYRQTPMIACNGIVVTRSEKELSPIGKLTSIFGDVDIRWPAFSVFDPQGNLSISLDRLRVNIEEVAFSSDILDDVLRNIVAYLFVYAPMQFGSAPLYERDAGTMKKHPAFGSGGECISWVHTSKGICPYDIDLIREMQIDHVIEVPNSGYIEIIEQFVRGSEYGIVIGPNSLWDHLERKDLKHVVSGAKRATYRDRTRLEASEERYLKDIVDLLRRPELWYSSPSQQVSDGWIARIIRRLGRILGFGRKIKYEGEFRNAFVKCLGLFPSTDEAIRVSELLERQMRVQGRVTAEMERAYDIVEHAATLDDLELHHRHLVQAGRILAGDGEEVRYYLYREGERIAERLRDWISNSYRARGSTVVWEVLVLLREPIKRARDSDSKLPGNVAEALRMLEWVLPRIEGEFRIEGRISSSIIDWDGLIECGSLKSGLSFTEYEIDRSVPTSRVSGTLAQCWMDCLGTAIVPYAFAQRKQEFHDVWARQDMKRHLEQWEALISDRNSYDEGVQ
jgi:hypothetical protein